MKKTLTIFTAILISSLIITSIAILSPVSAQTKYKVWGYVLNSDGQGLSGADVIFNVPDIVPGCVTNASGYYELNAPAGTYHLSVWPPYDQNYMSYDDPYLAVSSNMAKNITLQSGYKVSGYVLNTAGNPMMGAVVSIGGYGSGYFTTGTGYYFLSAPAGTYTINVHPRVGNYQSPTSQFSTYIENGFQVTGNTVRNIIINQQVNPTTSPTNTPSQPNPTPTVTPSPATYKISGYIQDQNGHGLPGASITFNAPNTVPRAFSDSSGYYQIYAPAGTYHVNVWPPFNSSCINYDETGFTVSQAMAKNITLTTGLKVSGFVKDSQGTPMVGASVLFKVGNAVYGSGYFTGTVGYYYAAIPPGTYTIDAHPQTAYDPSYSGTCTNFPTYLEYNFAVNGDIAKNITVNASPTSSTNPTNPPSQPNPTSTPSPSAPPGPNQPASHLTIETDASTYYIGSELTIEGKLTNQSMNPISNETVIFSYSLDNKQSWTEIGAAKTNSSGDYSIQWINNASGTFTLKAAYQGNGTQSGAEVTTTLSFLPYQDQKVFFVESNSTVTLLDFNTETLTLGFTVSGESGSSGYTKVTIAKSLIANFTGFTVYVDQTPVNSTVTSSDNYWIVEFDYHHSTHQVTIGLTGKAQSPFTASIPLIVGISVVIVAVAVGSFIAIRRLQRNK